MDRNFYILCFLWYDYIANLPQLKNERMGHMWILNIRSPEGEPRQHVIQAGNNNIGRMSGNDIVILDPSASRHHAKIVYDDVANTLVLHDLGSTNGTFVNRERLQAPRTLHPNDIIRIGHHTLELIFWEEGVPPQKNVQSFNTQHLTRDLILESLDRHAVLLAEVATRLNTVMDVNTALSEVANLMKASMGADRCEVILASQFNQLSQLGFATSIAQQAIEQRSAVVVQDAQSNPSLGKSAYLLRIHAAMCVPVVSGSEILALIYVFKNRAYARPFDQRDLQLAIAISHQAALTIQRMQLLDRIRKEEVVSRLLGRFLPPSQADNLLKEYLETGELPPLAEHNLTILAADICDSTGLAERLGAKRFSNLLSRYYEEMTKVIYAYNGMLNKYLGDGLMAIFGLPYQPPDPEERAILAGREMLNRLEILSQEFGQELSIGIGINSGPTVAGYMGTDQYLEFTVIGFPVNIAWSLEPLARPNRILIGHPTYQAVANKFRLRPIGEIKVKKGTDVLAYEVLPEAVPAN